METVLSEDETCQVIETTSAGWPKAAGSTRTVRTVWKPGYEPPAEQVPVTVDSDALATARAEVTKATSVAGMRSAVLGLIDLLAP